MTYFTFWNFILDENKINKLKRREQYNILKRSVMWKPNFKLSPTFLRDLSVFLLFFLLTSLYFAFFFSFLFSVMSYDTPFLMLNQLIHSPY